MTVLQIGLFLFLPALFIRGEKKFKWMAFFGTVVWCYLAGILMALLFPKMLNPVVTNRMVEASVLLAVPLLLLSLNIKAWLGNAKSTLISFVLSILSISLASMVVSLFFKIQMPISGRWEECWWGFIPAELST